MLNRFALAILTTSLLLSAAMAQVHSAGFGINPTGTGNFSRAGVPGGAAHIQHGHSRGQGVRGQGARGEAARSEGAVLLPYPGYYSDFAYDGPEAVNPQTIVVPASAPVQAPPAPSAPLQSLLIEWQGDHFERMTLSPKAAGNGQAAPDYSPDYSERSNSKILGPVAQGSAQPSRKGLAQSPRELPPAVLIFRDGRTEEVSNYTIMSGTIYSNSDYWTSGSWTKTIQIADLDVPATLKLNHEHGLNFVLPSSPNEVVIRP
jgi:hypothetical protein